MPRGKVVHFGSPGWIPMIQAPFNSSCVALQYKTGTKFASSMHKALAAELMNVSGLWDLNKQKIEELLCLLVFVGVLEVKDGLDRTSK